MSTLLSSFSAQQISVEHATGDSVVAKSFSAQSISVEKATGDSAIIKSLSSSRAGYDINGTKIVVPNMESHIVRVK